MTFGELMREEMKKSDSDLTAAVKAAQRRLDKDDKLYKELVVPMIRSALDEAGRNVLVLARRSAWRTPQESGEAKVSDAKRAGLRRLAVVNLMEWPLSQGKRLGDATRPTILSESASLIASGSTQVLRGEWLRLVAGRLKDDHQRVRQAMSEKQLRSLQRIAEQKVA